MVTQTNAPAGCDPARGKCECSKTCNQYLGEKTLQNQITNAPHRFGSGNTISLSLALIGGTVASVICEWATQESDAGQVDMTRYRDALRKFLTKVAGAL